MTQPSAAQMQAVAEAAAAFANMLSTAYRVPIDAEGRRILGDREIIQRLHVAISTEFTLADWAMMRLGDDETLAPYQYGMLDIIEKILGQLTAPPRLHPQFAGMFLRYRGLFAAAALPADGWITNPHHPARNLLTTILTAGLGWQPELGTAALSSRGQIEGWLEGICSEKHDWTQALALARQWLDDERRRAERVEKRLLESEAGVLRDRRARTLAAKLLNQSFADRLIGQDAAHMLVHDWLPALQSNLLRHGEQSPLWQKMKRTTASLRWTLSPELGDEARSKLFRLITQVSADIEELAPQMFLDAQTRERVIAVLEQEHLCVARNLPRASVPFMPLDTQDTLADTNTSLSATLLEKVRHLGNGDWLLLHEDHLDRRARILLKDDEARQCLLVNNLGVKVAAMPYEKLALALTNGSIEPLQDKPTLTTCVTAVIEDTRKAHQQAQMSRIEALRIAREQASADARAKEAARQKALAEAQALELARQEAQRRAKNAAPQTGNLQRARLMASSLTIGAWLVFRGDDGKPEQRRLTVILPSSGKYIFVDAAGGNKREVTRDELIRGLGEGSIAALTRDQTLDDALTRVVNGLRSERQIPGDMP